MTLLAKLAAIGSASIAAASVTWAVATSSPADDSSRQSSGGEPVVCAGPDTVLRLVAGDGKTCPPGKERVDVSEAEAEVPEVDDAGMDEPGAAEREKSKSPRLAALERRISALEQRSLFEVVDKAGNPIFRVAPESVLVYNNAQEPVAAIRASSKGGEFISRSAEGLGAAFGVSGLRSGVRISENGVTRADIGKQAQGNYAMRFVSPGGGVIAGVGESRGGTGAAIVGALTGTLLASMTSADGKGAIGVSSSSGAPVLSLSEGATRGGLLAIGDAASEPMVKMGVAQDRYGIVLTGPRAGFPLIPASGLPGSYIIGCSGSGKDCGPEPTMRH